MTLAELEEKYPDFDYFSVGINGNVYKFELDDDDDNFSIELTLSCDIEELLNDKNFINWLDQLLMMQRQILSHDLLSNH